LPDRGAADRGDRPARSSRGAGRAAGALAGGRHGTPLLLPARRLRRLAGPAGRDRRVRAGEGRGARAAAGARRGWGLGPAARGVRLRRGRCDPGGCRRRGRAERPAADRARGARELAGPGLGGADPRGAVEAHTGDLRGPARSRVPGARRTRRLPRRHAGAGGREAGGADPRSKPRDRAGDIGPRARARAPSGHPPTRRGAGALVKGAYRYLPISMKVLLPDGKELELEDGATGADAARAIGEGLARAALAIKVNGSLRDLDALLADGEPIQIVTDRSPEALELLRHDTAHVLAEAVLELYPGTQVTIGPPIDDGFYYDFDFPDGVKISDADFEAIEAKMREHIQADEPFERSEVTAEEAIEHFENEGQTYKVELDRKSVV